MDCADCLDHPLGLCLPHKLAGWRQSGGPNVAPSAMPTRQASRDRRKLQPTPNNSWERGVPTDERGMPYLDERGSVIGQKEWGQQYRRQFEEQKRRNANTPSPS